MSSQKFTNMKDSKRKLKIGWSFLLVYSKQSVIRHCKYTCTLFNSIDGLPNEISNISPHTITYFDQAMTHS